MLPDFSTRSGAAYVLLVMGFLLAGISARVTAEDTKEQTPNKKKLPAATYIGRLDDAPDSARVAVVIDGENVLAYVCSADDAFNQALAQWLQGTCAQSGEVKATSAEGLALSGRRLGDELKVALSEPAPQPRAGKQPTLQAKPARRARLTLVPPESTAGLYRAEKTVDGQEIVVGMIVDADKNVAGQAVVRRSQTLNASNVNSQNPQNITLNLDNLLQRRTDLLGSKIQNVIPQPPRRGPRETGLPGPQPDKRPQAHQPKK